MSKTFVHGKTVRVKTEEVRLLSIYDWDHGSFRMDVNVESLGEIKSVHEGIGEFLELQGELPAVAATLNEEYVAEALRATLRATSFEGELDGVAEDFIANYERAVEEGERA